MMEPETTHRLVIDFGRHKGELWTRVPIPYLRWLANSTHGEWNRLAKMELTRRGTAMPTDLELSGHSIDRASQITKEWEGKGVYSWLVSLADEALKEAEGEEVVWHKGFKFVFVYGEYYPTLKTIMVKTK